MNGTRAIQWQNFSAEEAGKLLLVLLPFAVWIANPFVLGNSNGDVDTWFYFGHFITLGKYSSYEFGGPGDYYATRLPFILPGYVIFQLFPLAWAKAIFAYLVYGTTMWCLFYTLRRHMPERTAILVLLLLASDIFFVRTVNWNYVDAGVVVYQSLTLASLTAAAESRRKRLWAGLAGFFFTSSVFCHLGIILSALPIAIYAWFCLDLGKRSRKEIVQLFLSGLAGVAIGQIVFGLLNVWLNRGDFFFIWLLYKIAKGETHSVQVDQTTPWLLLRNYGWLTIPFAVWIASGAALLSGVSGFAKLERPQKILLAMGFFISTFLFILDQIHFSYYLGRDGMYVSTYLPFCYMALAGLLMGNLALPTRSVFIAGLCFFASLVLRLQYDGAGIPWLPEPQMWIPGVVLCLLLLWVFSPPQLDGKRLRCVWPPFPHFSYAGNLKTRAMAMPRFMHCMIWQGTNFPAFGRKRTIRFTAMRSFPRHRALPSADGGCAAIDFPTIHPTHGTVTRFWW